MTNITAAVFLSMLIMTASSFALDLKSGEDDQAKKMERDRELLLSIDDYSVYRSVLIERTGMRNSDNKGVKKSSLRLELPPIVNDTVKVGMAYITNFLFHELGHKVMADYANATETEFNLFNKQDSKFFLGQSTYKQIDSESKLPFNLAGEAAADLTFEHALQDYRKNPTPFNKSLLLFSGTDFLIYCFYAYYLSEGHPHYDPTAIASETGMSKDSIFSVALAKTLINAHRVYSGKDYIIPYFAVNRDTAMLNVKIDF